MTTRAVFLWHMHQPDYRDPESGRPLLPWVRLHATRAYTDMADALWRHPEIRAVVNWAPSLLLQLRDHALGLSQDLDEQLARREAGSLSPDERAHILAQGFSVNRDLWVKTQPRYAELLARRGEELRGIDLGRLQEQFSARDLDDVQVHFALAWMGFTARRDEPLVRALLEKQQGFSQAEKVALLDLQRAIASRLLGRYRALSERGQIELTCSPLYHPILPLLLDSDCARRAMPDATLPPRFSYPEDARIQVLRALALSEEIFGVRPVGMWPSEGSVSPETLELFGSCDLAWCATDQKILEQSKLAAGAELRAPWHHRAWSVPISSSESGAVAGARSVSMIFRDAELSDAVGFRYSRAPDQAAAAQELVDKLAGAGDAQVAIILDGENAWEHYPRSGELFLEALYEKLGAAAKGRRVQTVLPREELGAAPPKDRIARLHSGSWIESNFRIWIGHPEDNAAWTLLGKARAKLASMEREQSLGPEQLARAREALLPAEGSDWFWWYGDDFQSDNLAQFDALFRRHVAACWRALGLETPEELGRPIISPNKDATAALAQLEMPRRLISPSIDGRALAYHEWIGAGLYRPGRSLGGSMHQGEPAISTLWFGFGAPAVRVPGAAGPVRAPFAARLYLRVDSTRSLVGSLRILLRPAGRPPLELAFRIPPRGESALVLDPDGRECGRGQSDAIVELVVELAPLGLATNDRFGLLLRLLDQESELERLPRYGELELSVPGPEFEASHWRV